MAKKESLLLQPIRGKFVQSSINGKIVRVWLVNPDTNQQGTEIPYDDAIALLALRHPVVCMAQIKGKDGKYCNKLDEEDMKAVEAKKKDFINGIVGQNPIYVDSPKNDETLKQLVETQGKLIESQNKQLEEMQSKFAETQKMLEKLLKKADKADK